MKTPISATRRGIALVIVLSLLVLITVLVVGFLVRVGSERTASANYYVTATTRQLADTAVNLVQAQINEATTNGSGTNAWVSQPGALRVFDNTGQLSKIYRLYSAPSMVTSGADPTVLKDDVPDAKWTKNPAVWVDLNAPVTISGGTSAADQYSVFPILDPRDPANPGTIAAPSVTGTLAGFSLTGTAPGATTAQPVPMPVQWLYVLQNGQIVAPSGSGSTSVTISGASKTNPVVGRIAFWTDDECAKVNINTAAGSLSVRPDPSTGNTSNAVLPAPWDTPRFNNWDETRLFAQNQPVKQEYQRYPGHPATTDLYNILNALGVSLPNYPVTAGATYSGTAPMAKPTSGTTSLNPLLPRYGEAWSSMAGTAYSAGMAGDTGTGATPVSLPTNRLYTSLGEMYFNSGTNSRLSNGLTRQQLESGKFFLTAHSRAPEANLFGMPRISMWPIDSDYGSNPVTSNTTPLASVYDRLFAFCTTTGTGSSRHPYYIQRHNAYSPTDDANIQRNQELYGYLQRLAATEIPGFGGNFENKYNAGESDQILTEMVDYVRSTNVFDHSTASGTVGFTKRNDGAFSGYGQVVPLQIGSTQGLGRMFTISEVGLHVICTADGNSTLGTYQVPVSSGTTTGTSTVVGSANDYRYVSNLPVAQFLRGTDGKVWGLNSTGPVFSGTGDYSAGSKRVSQVGGDAPFPANPTLSGSALSPGYKQLQAMLVMELQCPMQGYDLIYPNVVVKVTNLGNVSIGGSNPFPARCDGVLANTGHRTNSWTGYGGYQQFSIWLTVASGDAGSNLRGSGCYNVLNRLPPDAPTPAASGSAYYFVSNPFTVPDSGAGSINISGGPVKIELQVPPASGGTPVTVQTFNVSFPSTTTPTPDLMQYGLKTVVTSNSANFTSAWDWWGFDNRIYWATNWINYSSKLDRGCVFRIDPANTSGTSTAGVWNFMTASTLPMVPYIDPKGNKTTSYPSDVVRTLIAKDGDVRLVMAKTTVTADGNNDMVRTAGYDDRSAKLAHNFVCDGNYQYPGGDQGGKLVPNVTYTARYAPKVPSNASTQSNWDWDTGQIPAIDGAYANKPDEGNVYVNGGNIPYFQGGNNIKNQAALSSYFTANRIIPSPVMFGSLPSGVKHNVSWRTLLFRPATTSDSTTYVHDSLGTPPDHLLLDWFTLPVVEPYAISEPFSTAGKINMNYQIVPFTYINRSVGLRAVLGSELIARVPRASGTMGYKAGNASGSLVTAGGVTIARLPMNLDETNGTLRQFKDKFDSWGVFKSPSEICDIYLVPKPYTWPGFDLKWYGDDFALVGDNVRERPYADIYPRLTTKSNTYTVHFRVQAIKNPPTNKPDTWNESTGVISGEYRGSTTIERYLDPSNKDIPDYATTTGNATLDSFYQWRTVSNTAFAP